MNPAASATLSTKPISGGGLLLHRHCIPLSRPAVAYFRADVLNYLKQHKKQQKKMRKQQKKAQKNSKKLHSTSH
jgi:hypothetical protein